MKTEMIRKVTRALMAVAITLALGSVRNDALAQAPGGEGGMRMMRGNPDQMQPEVMANQVTMTMKEKLTLDTNQVVAVKALALERFTSMKKVLKDAQAKNDWASIRPAMQEAETTFDASMKDVLKADQWAKYEKYREEQKARRRQMQMERMREGGGE